MKSCHDRIFPSMGYSKNLGCPKADIMILSEENHLKQRKKWDITCIESFHSLIKREWLNRFLIRNMDHARRLIFEYIDTFYNTTRIHSACGYFSLEEFERNYEQRVS